MSKPRKTRYDIAIGPRVYYDTRGRSYPATIACEHCDGADSDYVRVESLRGHVCPPCDAVLDEMLA